MISLTVTALAMCKSRAVIQQSRKRDEKEFRWASDGEEDARAKLRRRDPARNHQADDRIR